jgi:hypothetical protein
MTMGTEDDRDTAHCWFEVDRVPRDPATTAWKRLARRRQAKWRESRGYPVGAQPYRGGDGATPVGSRLDLDFARATGANFLTPAALTAVRSRLASPETHQMISEERLWADLLSSMPLCFNVCGDLSGDAERAATAVRSWWPDAPPGLVTTKVEHSPGRRDAAYLGNQSAFDVSFDIDTGNGTRAILGVETKYHEHANPERSPRPAALHRYVEVTERSGVFVDGWRSAVVGTELQQIWLDHLLVLAMLQHPSGTWGWGRFVLVYPSENPSFARAAAAYHGVLRDPATFESRTLESLIDSPAVLPAATRAAVLGRYFGGAAP